MKKKVLFFVLAVVLLASGIIPGAVRAEDGPAVLSSTAEMDFPSSLTFDISARSGTDITDIRLHYTVDRMKHVNVIAEAVIAFTPGRNVTARHVMDMRQTGGMPPGSVLTYWWTVTDASGQFTETLPQRVNIVDGRYNWHSLKEGLVTLYWYKGDDAFAEELMDAAQQALGRLDENSGATLEKPVSLYIYANSSDLQGSMIFPQEWTGGVAFTEYGIIAIGIGTGASELAWGKRAISHELPHLVVHQVTFNPYNQVPPWLDEGLAMNSEGELESQFAWVLENAITNDSLISVRSLSSPFSAYADQSILAYAESYEIVRYLIDEYGREKMFELLGVFSEGSSYGEALMTVYGFDMEELNALWQAAPVP